MHSKKMITSFTVSIKIVCHVVLYSVLIAWFVFIFIKKIQGDYDGSDNEYYDDNEYDNSDSKGYGSENQKHWERDIQPDLSNIKEEKVELISILFIPIDSISTSIYF